MKMNWPGLVLVLASLSTLSQAQNLQDLKEKLLFKYDKSTKPDGQVQIDISIKPINIDLNPVSETMILTTWNSYTWTDPRLTWDPLRENHIQELKLDFDQVWRPDIVPYNKQKPTQLLGRYQAIVYFNGMVLMIPEETNEIFCPINVENWPYGPQNCTYKMGSWHYSLKDVNIQGKAGNLDDVTFLTSQFIVEGVSVQRDESKYSCCTEMYPHLSISIVFRRLKLWNPSVANYNLTHIEASSAEKLRLSRFGTSSSPQSGMQNLKSPILWVFMSILFAFGQ